MIQMGTGESAETPETPTCQQWFPKDQYLAKLQCWFDENDEGIQTLEEKHTHKKGIAQ